MEFSLILIFWYGILHAFGPDHLTAITDFSIGKDQKKTMLITILFAMGHGMSLFLFAKILASFDISETVLGYGDIISGMVILGMGLYLLAMVAMDRIHLRKHMHHGNEQSYIWFGRMNPDGSVKAASNTTHTHVWVGEHHEHDDEIQKGSSFTMGLLMGAGGVRGMLVTLGAVGSGNVDMTMVFAFTTGVMLVFVLFGLGISYLNQNLLQSKKNVRVAFATAGLVSLVVGSSVLFA